MNILVHGNGFDIAHGLTTKYNDFLKSTRAFLDYKNDKQIDENYLKYFQKIKSETPNLIKELHAMIDENIRIAYFNSIVMKLLNEGKKGWIDFESEISAVKYLIL